MYESEKTVRWCFLYSHLLQWLLVFITFLPLQICCLNYTFAYLYSLLSLFLLMKEKRSRQFIPESMSMNSNLILA